MVLRFEIRALYLLGNFSTTGAMIPALFVLVIFFERGYIFAQADLRL
jgi:hypothetical protein